MTVVLINVCSVGLTGLFHVELWDQGVARMIGQSPPPPPPKKESFLQAMMCTIKQSLFCFRPQLFCFRSGKVAKVWQTKCSLHIKSFQCPLEQYQLTLANDKKHRM